MGEDSNVRVSFCDRVGMGYRNDFVVDHGSGDEPLAEHDLHIAAHSWLEVVGDVVEQDAVIHGKKPNFRMEVRQRPGV